MQDPGSGEKRQGQLQHVTGARFGGRPSAGRVPQLCPLFRLLSLQHAKCHSRRCVHKMEQGMIHGPETVLNQKAPPNI